MRRKAGLALLYLVSTLILLGGVGDIFITELLDAQRDFLSGGGAYEITAPARTSFLEILHALGGGLAGVGFASLLLVHFGIRRGHKWAVVAMLGAVVAAEGTNTLGMLRLGSPFYIVTLTYLVILALGLALLLIPSFSGAQIDSGPEIQG